MQSQPQNIRDEKMFRYASAKRYLKIFVPDFAFKHDDNSGGKDKFVGREIQLRKLYTWLTSDSKSGSYLITGYRGMGKSLLVKRVLEMITREPKAYKEVLFQIGMALTIAACFLGIVINTAKPFAIPLAIVFFCIAVILMLILELSKQYNYVLYERQILKFPFHHIFNKDMIAKVWLKMLDRRGRKYHIIAVTVNLGQEVLHERDVLSLIAQNVREKYARFVQNRQNRPVTSFLMIGGFCIFSFLFTRFVLYDALQLLGHFLLCHIKPEGSWISATIVSLLFWIRDLIAGDNLLNHLSQLLIYLLIYLFMVRTFKGISKHAYFVSLPFNTLQRLDLLCDRIASTVNVEEGSHPQYSSSFFNFSFGKEGKMKTMPKATVRELEQELLGILNDINGDDCPRDFRAQFILVFDELDKITKAAQKNNRMQPSADKEMTPEFDTSVKGFTDAMAYEERKQNVLRLLANMKLFIASVKAKCVFISGHELFDASLADLSDREFAISSIFNGVLNVSSFLSPEREQSDVSSMTEVYLATMLLPENYLRQKITENVLVNGVLKDELPSLRWYNEYLMELHVQKNPNLREKQEIKKRVLEIRHVMEFLRCFAVYLSHVSNGSPKKIAAYFEKYVKVNYDAIGQFDWCDEIVVGQPTEKDVRKQCVLYFSPDNQKLINFIHYIAAPVMNAITNEVSHYGDKLLVSSSFMLDQIYKYHGKGFSWRNLEQMPELLNTNKNPELRDSMSSIVQFLLQTHMTMISSGVFQYKFHKQISEEISALSKTSEEAAAIFNFTLNESETVKRYNTRLLWHYVNLANGLKDSGCYDTVLERIHENLGDIYFSEEDYYRAIHEYRSALHCMSPDKLTATNLLPYLKCSLKIGMSYEYRRTFEKAYMTYCQIINQLVHIQWYEEKDLGLDYTMRLTNDWRLKQTVLVDRDSTRRLFGYCTDETYHRQFLSGLMEDLTDSGKFHPQYSLDSDKAISGLSINYTPEKSNIFLKLTAFEDVKYIYQAIIAKLFVIEKMEVSGITQSSIDAAEAEFITLYGSTNYKEKFMLAVDFFSKLAGILYYKNNFVTADPIDNMSSALYVFDINVMALLDDYCFKMSGRHNADNAIKIKDDIRKFFDVLKIKDVDKANCFVDLYKTVSGENAPAKYRETVAETKNNVEGYLKYLDNYHFGSTDKEINIIDRLWDRLKNCAMRREKLAKAGCKLPCNACKYANRSLLILMDKMFADNDYKASLGVSKVIILLRNTSHRHVRFLRREHLSALAYSSEQLADIMLSCACSNVAKQEEDKVDIHDIINKKTIYLLMQLSDAIIDEGSRRKNIEKYVQDINADKGLGKLDRSLLYYWSAYRYYEIALMYHESEHCLERIARVLEDYLSVSEMKLQDDEIKDWTELLDNLFTHASRTVGHQYDNFDMAEIHEMKWLFHLEHTEDVDLSILTQYDANLQSLFLSLVRSKAMLMGLSREGNIQYVIDVYKRVAPALRNECTFKAEVEQCYTKVLLNRYIFVELMDGDFMKEYKKSLYGNEKRYYQSPCFGKLAAYLEADHKKEIEEKLFHIDGSVQARLNLIDYLVFDSLVCLYNILRILPPHNQISTFTNSFTADVYYSLWEWSKYYEMIYDLYFYYRCYQAGDDEGSKKIVAMIERLSEDEKQHQMKYNELIAKCAEVMKNGGVVNKDDFGYRYTKLFMNLRHEMDDATMHHIYTNYSAEMAIKYYRAARGVNSEGMEYKDLIYGMYVLDDDLRNDTCQSNLADERYLLNSGVISTKRKELQKMYEDSNINMLKHYEAIREIKDDRTPHKRLDERFADSLFTNTEY